MDPTRRGSQTRARMSTAPRSFLSPGGRRFTIKSHEHEEGRWGPEDRWVISYGRKPAGTLLRGYPYSGDTPWSATTRQLYWRYAADAPTGIGFDVAAYETVGEVLRAWGRSADQILDWAEGKPGKTGSFSRDPRPRVSPRQRAFISEKIPILRREGYPHQQAIAIAHRMAGVPLGRRRGKQ
jgi:hypothetical protein